MDAAHLVLSASTSEAYGWLFKLLCDPGDNVLVPAPGYPLFEYLARLEGVHARPYRLPARARLRRWTRTRWRRPSTRAPARCWW